MNFTESSNIKTLAELFNNVPALIAIVEGPEHIFRYANGFYLSSVQRTSAVIGKSMKEVFPEFEGQGIYEIMDKVFRTGEDHKIMKLRADIDMKGNGVLEERYFNVIYHPVKKDNIVTGIFIHASDISDLVQSQKNTEQAKEELETIITNATVATALYEGRELRIKMANEKMIAVWGKEQSVLGKTLADALPELEGQPFLKILDDVFTSGKMYHSDEQKCMLQIDGVLQAFWFNFSYKPLLDSNGKVYAILNMAVDVTYQVNAKQQLQYTEQKLRSAIEVANLGTWERNLVTGTMEVNARLAEWRGLPDEADSSPGAVLQNSPDRDIVLDKIAAAMQPDSDGIIDMEYSMINHTTNELKRLHSLGKIFFNEERTPVLMSGITHDITSHWLTEAELQKKINEKTAALEKANDDLQSVNGNLEQFVYVASHDLQEPLRKIKIFSEMLERTAGEISEEGTMYLGKISNAASRMSVLIKDLLEFSRVVADAGTFLPVDLNKLINEIKTDYELLIRQKNAVFQIADLPVITAVPLQMNQLFFNLIGNALKFAKQDTPALINIGCSMLTAAEKEALQLDEKMAYCNIEVSDNGIGFNPKYAQKIFEIFQRLHGKDEYAGTGIGLSMAKKIVDNHRGHISASAELNNGAVFNVILPVSRNTV